MKLWKFILFVLLMVPLVIAVAESDYTYTFDFLNPDDEANIYPANRDVNFTFNVTTLGVVLNVSDTLNCSIYNSTDGINYSILVGPMNITNSTWNDTTVHMTYGRTNWFVNCSTMFSTVNQTYGISEIRYFDIINTTTYDSVSPVDGVVLSGVDVNFTWRVNATNYNLINERLNCSVHNASSVSGEKSELFKFNVTNGTISWNDFAMAPYFDFTNVYWNINCTNGSIETISEDYSFGLQTNYEYTWQVPDDNAVLSDLEVNYSWRPTVIDISLANDTRLDCSVQHSYNLDEGFTTITTPINTTNNTIRHQVVTLGNRSPTSWRVNCSNGTIDFLSDVYTLSQSYSFETTNVNPPDGAVLTSRNVNYSWKFESYNVNLSTQANASCTVFRNGSVIINKLNTTNATERNTTIVTYNGYYNMTTNCTSDRGEIFWNMSDVTYFTVAEPVGGSMTYDLLAPGEVDILSSTSVNFSWTVSLVDGFLDTNEQLECGLYNRSSSAANYSVLFKANITNSTFFNYTATLVTDNYHWWFVNCTTPITQTSPINELSDTRIFEVVGDAIFYKYGLGFFDKINFTLNTGLMQTDYGVQYGGAATADCGASTRGLIIYNSTQGFLGCTEGGWKSLNTTVV